MAHLVKLEEYKSRYESDLHRYPSQFTRMKKERWYYLKTEWEQLQLEQEDEKEVVEQRLPKKFLLPALQRVQKWSGRTKQATTKKENVTLEQLKEQYVTDLFMTQLKWANSSLLEPATDMVNAHYVLNEWLRFFAREFPDNYFLMYHPTFYLKKAPIELDVILISPTEIICVTVLEGQEHSIFEASSGRFWLEYIDKTRKNRISPLLSLSRMVGVVETVLDEAGLHFPIRQVVITRRSMIDHKMKGTKAELIDRRTFDEWHERLRRHPSPIKNSQMQVCATLLASCQMPNQVEDEETEEKDS